jgi:hypothetical protein
MSFVESVMTNTTLLRAAAVRHAHELRSEALDEAFRAVASFVRRLFTLPRPRRLEKAA